MTNPIANSGLLLWNLLRLSLTGILKCLQAAKKLRQPAKTSALLLLLLHALRVVELRDLHHAGEIVKCHGSPPAFHSRQPCIRRA